MPGNLLVLPEGDFTSAQFDAETFSEPKSLVLILSTPRSGSTLACDILHGVSFCTAHEYFQPFQIRPVLEERWAVQKNDHRAYCAALVRYRTSSKGVLGINLHAHHLPHWDRARMYLPTTLKKVRYVWIARRDKLAQAVSYEIAAQTGQWSSAFVKVKEAEYDYESILRRLRFLRSADRKIRRYLFRRGRIIRPLFYEDFAHNRAHLAKRFGIVLPQDQKPSIVRQSGGVNAEMIKRFEKEYWSRRGDSPLKRFLVARDLGISTRDG